MQDRQGVGRIFSALMLAVTAPLLVGNTGSGQDISVSVTDLRSTKGKVLACLTADAKTFPNCDKDPKALAMTVNAGTTVSFSFRGVKPGTYAISLLHDENGNGKADKALMIPKEGFGFSRDAKVRMGPPKFSAASFAVGAEPVHQRIKMRYLF